MCNIDSLDNPGCKNLSNSNKSTKRSFYGKQTPVQADKTKKKMSQVLTLRKILWNSKAFSIGSTLKLTRFCCLFVLATVRVPCASSPTKVTTLKLCVTITSNTWDS